MYEFGYDYIKLKYGDRAKLCYMGTDSFIIHIITEDFYEDIGDDVERQFDASNYDENKTGKRPLPIGINKKLICFFKHELGARIMKEFCALRPKIYAYLMEDDCEKKKAKVTKKAIIKRRLMFKNYKDCLPNNTVILRLQQRFKNDCHEMYTEEVNKIVLSSDDGKRLPTFDRVKTYPPRINAFKVCENEMMISRKFFVTKYADCPFYSKIVSK